VPVQLHVSKSIGHIILNRPPVNALDRAHQRELARAALDAGRRREIRAVVIHGAEGVFSAGADIREMQAMSQDEMKAHAPILQDTFRAVAEIPKPVCAAIEGYALGGGLELALAADFRVCSGDAQIGLPEISLGVIPGAGGTQRLTRLVGPAIATRLIMTGTLLEIDEAARLGLVTVAPPGSALATAYDLLAPLLELPTSALAAAKRAIAAARSPDGLAEETARFAALFGTPGQREGMRAFLEKREPNFHP
jgi:enoyl-CoA hydratase/carnithine racemase